jgi:hypothetical protein
MTDKLTQISEIRGGGGFRKSGAYAFIGNISDSQVNFTKVALFGKL